MDTKTLITEAKARFNHNSARAYLKEKYEGKLLVADQGGLWKADQQTIMFLGLATTPTLILVDTFGNPVEVNRAPLASLLLNTYKTVMAEWLAEWKELENKR